MVRPIRQRCRIRIDFNDRRAMLQRFEGERGCGMDNRGSADGEKDVAGFTGGDGGFDGARRQHFAEPNDVGTQSSTATRTARRDFAGLLPRFDDGGFLKTFRPLYAAVEFENVPAAGALMKAIHVLCDQSELWNASFDFGQREVAWVGLRLRDQF